MADIPYIDLDILHFSIYWPPLWLADIPYLDSQGDWASHREAGPLTRRQGLSKGGWASHREAGPLTGRPGLS